MGLCSAAAIAFALCLEDRRWLWAGLAGIAAVTVAGLLRLPLADRIVTVMDPAWRAVVEARSPILFPSLWPAETWGRLAVHLCSLAAAACLLKDAPRRLALGALIAGVAGVAVVAVLGDWLSLLLFLQAQSWRMLQPVSVLAVASLALLAFELPRRGPSGLLGLAFLGVAWMFRDVANLGLLTAPVGLLFVLAGDKIRFSRPALFSGVAMVLLVVGVAGDGALRGLALARTLAQTPPAWGFSQSVIWSSELPGLVLALALGVWLARGWSAPPVVARVALTAAVGLAAALSWDDRSDFVKARDAGRDPALVAMTAARQGEVLWLVGDVEPWTLLGRPGWSSKVQSAGVVFSRPLALKLWDRAERLKAAGLVSDDWMRGLTLEPKRPARPRPDRVRAFCAAADAPAWIIWARWNDMPVDPALGARDWASKAPFVYRVDEGWLTASRYAVIPCAGG
jgi:hypothetical protein